MTRRTRRACLRSAGTVTALALAGCNREPGTETTDERPADESASTTAAATTDAATTDQPTADDGDDRVDATPVDARWWATAGHDARNTAANPSVTAPTTAVGVADVLGRGGYTQPVVVDGNAYVTTPDAVTAVDLDDGTDAWSIPVDVDRRPVPPTVTAASAFVHDAKLRAVDRETGDVAWTLGTGSRTFRSTAPTVTDGTVYVSRAVYRPEAGDPLGASGVYAVDAASGAREWYFDDATASGAIAVDGDAAYFGSENDAVYALDASTGRERWSFETDHSVLAAVAVADETVFAGSLDNSVYALDAATGEERWSAATFGAVQTQPAVADGTVIVASGGSTRTGNVYAFDAATGEEHWTFEYKRPVPVLTPVVAGDVAFVQLASTTGDGAGTIYGLEVADGTLACRVTPPTVDATPFAPVPAGDALYAQFVEERDDGDAASTRVRLCRLADDAGDPLEETCEPVDDGPLPAVVGPWSSEGYDAANAGAHPDDVGVLFVATHADGVVAVNAADGSVRWRTNAFPGVQSAPTVVDGRVLVGVNRAPYGVYAFDAGNGRRLWTAQAGSTKTTPTVVDGVAYVGTYTELATYDVASGERRWGVPGEDRFLSSPVVRDGTVVAGNESGRVHAVDAADGGDVWRTDLGSRAEVKAPVALGDRSAFATTADGALFALALDDGGVRWAYEGFEGFERTGAVVAGGRAFAAGARALHAVDVADGSVAWTFAPGEGTPTAPAVAGDVAFVGTDAALYALDVADGTERWRYETDGAVNVAPIVDAETAFASTSDGRVRAVDRATGRERWRTASLGSVGKMNADGALAGVTTVTDPAGTTEGDDA